MAEAKGIVAVKDTGDIRPVPDPTALTTQAILRELGSLREVLEAVIDGQKSLFDVRLDGMDKAIVLLQTIMDKQPGIVDQKISTLQKLHEEKFASIGTQFIERDTRTEQTSRDSKVAVDAALQAAKEAVGEQNRSSSLAINKSEAATGKQIDQIGLLIGQNAKATDDKIDDLKERLTRMEGAEKGQSNAWVWIFAAIGALVGLAGIVVAIIR